MHQLKIMKYRQQLLYETLCLETFMKHTTKTQARNILYLVFLTYKVETMGQALDNIKDTIAHGKGRYDSMQTGQRPVTHNRPKRLRCARQGFGCEYIEVDTQQTEVAGYERVNQGIPFDSQLFSECNKDQS
jgi:hypothetical protein